MKNKVISLMLGIIGVCSIAGCGGGGTAATSAFDGNYTGNTSQAVITTSNAKALTSSAFLGVQSVSVFGALGKIVGTGTSTSFYVIELSNIVENRILATDTIVPVTAKAVALTETKTFDGVTGYYSYSIELDEANGIFSGIFTFADYQQSTDAATMSGVINCSGVYDQSNRMYTSLNLVINGLSIVKDTFSESMYGTIAIAKSGSTKTITTSAVVRDNSTSRTSMFKNLTYTFVGTTLTIDGLYYDPTHGYVVISTGTPLTSAILYGTPTSGQLLFFGANNSKARLTLTNMGNSLEVDAAGNDAFVSVI